MSGTFWIPPESEVARDAALLQAQLDDVLPRLQFWNNELRQIDPYLKVVRAKPGAHIEDGLKPDYYHIIRIRPGTMAYVKPVQYPDGTWHELDSYVLELVQEDDLWNDRTQRERRKIRVRAEEARQRQKERESQDRVDELNERYRSATSTMISVPRSI